MSNLKKDIIKQWGDVLISSDFIVNSPQEIIPVSPALDVGLSGGIPEGTWTIISGPEKGGKSSTALTIAAHAQQQGRPVYYLDIEGRLKKMNLVGIQGLKLDDDSFQIIRPTKQNMLSAEDFCNIAVRLIKEVDKAFVIFDSTSALCSRKEMDEDITGQTRALGPKILASFCRKLGTIVPIQKSNIIMIQHLIANTSGYGSPYMEDSGRKVKYQADVKLKCKGFSLWKDGDEIIGQCVKWSVVTSALGAPGHEVESFLRYGVGIDKVWEAINLGCELGIIEKAGAWYTIGDDKVQGQQKLWKYFSEDEKAQLKLLKQIREML